MYNMQSKSRDRIKSKKHDGDGQTKKTAPAHLVSVLGPLLFEKKIRSANAVAHTPHVYRGLLIIL